MCARVFLRTQPLPLFPARASVYEREGGGEGAKGGGVEEGRGAGAQARTTREANTGRAIVACRPIAGVVRHLQLFRISPLEAPAQAPPGGFRVLHGLGFRISSTCDQTTGAITPTSTRVFVQPQSASLSLPQLLKTINRADPPPFFPPFALLPFPLLSAQNLQTKAASKSFQRSLQQNLWRKACFKVA
jgi:hypothetical protein